MNTIWKGGLVAVASALLSVACAVKPTPAPAPAPDSGQPATAQQVHELMQVVGVTQLMQTMMGQMDQQLSAVMQKDFPCVPAGYWSGFLGAEGQHDMLERLVPVYQRHFTRGELDQLLTFYRTPLGQKVIHEMPAVMKDAIQVGRTWGQDRARKMMDGLVQQGILNEKMQCPGTARPDTGGG